MRNATCSNSQRLNEKLNGRIISCFRYFRNENKSSFILAIDFLDGESFVIKAFCGMGWQASNCHIIKSNKIASEKTLKLLRKIEIDDSEKPTMLSSLVNKKISGYAYRSCFEDNSKTHEIQFADNKMLKVIISESGDYRCEDAETMEEVYETTGLNISLFVDNTELWFHLPTC